MPENSSQERTEEATPKRKSDARKRGQIARSTELPGAVGLLGGALAIRIFAPAVWTAISDMVRKDLAAITRPDLTVQTSTQLLQQSAIAGGLAILPIVLTLMVAGAGAGLLQTGLNFSAGSLKPKFERVNPMAGIKRIFSMATGFELLKMMVRLGVFLLVAVNMINELATRMVIIGSSGLTQAPAVIGDLLFTVILRLAMVGGLLAGVDYLYQRWKHTRDLRMTKQEVKEESRLSEGNPEMKARVRRVQREMARKRMMQEVPKSTVVLANPDHYAVAIRYQSGKTRAPIVVAKGKDLVAQQIKALARQHNVPVIENPPLTRAIFAAVDINHEIPAQFYRAIAEVLAFVYKLKRRW